jgi:cytochrome c553
MGWPKNLRFSRAMFWLMVFGAAGVVAVAVFLLSGVYNVGASVKHFAATERIIKVVLRRSIATHTDWDEPLPDLADPGLATLGARHFETGCAPCHGSPARAGSAVVARMYPSPPSLRHAASDWKTRELFWIVQNGLKFTGMPAWPGAGRQDEVWPLVAFLEALPDLGPAAYAAMVDPVAAPTPGEGLDLGPVVPGAGAVSSSDAALLRSCTGCHGAAGEPPVDALVPSLAGQNAAYLERALREYRADVRQSGMMETVAKHLTDEAIVALADHFAAAPAIERRYARPADPGALERGRRIVASGIPAERIPPCAACHSAGRSQHFPRIAGHSETYLRMQLELFHDGVRAQSAYAGIMHQVARRLEPRHIADVAAYLATLPVDAPLGAEAIAGATR